MLFDCPSSSSSSPSSIDDWWPHPLESRSRNRRISHGFLSKQLLLIVHKTHVCVCIRVILWQVGKQLKTHSRNKFSEADIIPMNYTLRSHYILCACAYGWNILYCWDSRIERLETFETWDLRQFSFCEFLVYLYAVFCILVVSLELLSQHKSKSKI